MSSPFDLHPSEFDLPPPLAASLDAAGGGVRFLPWEGARIAYDLEVPDPSRVRQLLLLVNGYQRTRLDFRAFRKRLAAVAPHVATAALDNRGCGETSFLGDVPETLSLARMALDAGALGRALATRLGLEGFGVLGISMGGMISQVVASHCPGVRKLVLVSTTAGGHGRVWPAHSTPRAPSALSEGEGDGENGAGRDRLAYKPWPTDLAGMRRRMERYFGPRFLGKSPLLVDIMVKNMLKAQGAGSPPGTTSWAEIGSRLQFQASASFDGTGLLARIGVPTLVVTGSDDAIIPKENAYFLQARLPDSRLVEYPEVGHLILVEEPEAFVLDVSGFLG